MKRYFTLLSNTLVTGKKNINSAKIFFLAILLCSISNIASAAITVTTLPTNGMNICSNLAVGGSAAAFTTLTPIVITEGLANDFGNNTGTWTVTIYITPPTGWQFNAAATPTLGFTAGADITSVTITTPPGYSANSLPIKVSGTGDVNIDAITITGLQVQATSTSSAPGNITPQFVMGTATGLTGLNLASLSLNPAAITGGTTVCIGGTTALSDATAAGAWSSSVITTATVVAATGVVTGVAAGAVNIDYTVGGCATIHSMTVNTTPSAISGVTTVCGGSTTTLSDPISGGVWTSATTTVATVTGNSGVVSGVPTVTTTSTSVITYSVSACPSVNTTVTVNPKPGAITGTTIVCVGGTTTLSDNLAGGTWSSATSAVATVVAGTGVVSGASAGTAPISYTITATGCYATTTVTVHAQPTAITGTPTVCSGATTTLGNSIAGGIWTSGTTTVATVGSASGIVSGVPTVVVQSISLITYSVSACPAAVITVTVNPTPAAITGPTAVCQNSTIALSDPTAGGAWSSSITTDATVTGGGVVTGVAAGTPYISYTLSGCTATQTVLVNPRPMGIAGITSVCTGLTTDLSDATAGGAWSSITTTVAVIGTGTGIVTGSTAGTSVINYTLGTGCLRSTNVTVNQSPDPIAGTPNACVGQTTTLSDDIAGGLWSSSTSAVATVGSANGLVSAVTSGTTTITYKIPVTNCAVTAIVTINAVPSAISGITTLCQTALTSLSDTSPGGLWSSSNTSVAIVGATGLLSGVSGGMADITYAFGATCFSTTTVTVNPSPVSGTITGADSMCLGSVITLSDASAGGVWSSSNTAIATVSATGVVSGVALGAANIIYTVTNGCGSVFTSYGITVDLLTPQVIISGDPGLTSCIGIPDTFTATPVNGGTSPTYQWKVNGTIVSTANPYFYTPTNGDIVICTMISNASCLLTTVTSATVTVVINATLVPAVTISTGAYTDTVCVATLTAFTATPVNGGSAPAYQWTVNGTLSGTTNPFNYTPVNGDVISCELTSSLPCAVPATAMSNSVTMTVVAAESPTLDITSSGNPSCKGSPVTFTSHTLYGGIAPFIRWTQNGVNVATGPTYTIVPDNGDQFYCMLRSSNSCIIFDSVFSNTIIMTVDSPIVPVVTVAAAHTVITTAQYDTLIAVVTPVTITPTYQWYLNGVAIAGATSSVYAAHVSTTGIDYFYCIVGNGNACNTSAISTLITLTVNPSGVNQLALGADDLKLVPNPNDGDFTIEGTISSDDQDVMIEITNVVGQVVYKEVAPVQNQILNKQISLENGLTNGIYLLNVITNNVHKVIRFTLNR